MKIIRNGYRLKLILILIVSMILSSCEAIGPIINTDKPVINSFTADSEFIAQGDSVTLSWSVADATMVTINPGGGTFGLIGTTNVYPTNNTTFTLTATNSAGSTSATVPVTVYQILTIQPGIEEGKSSYIIGEMPDSHFYLKQNLSIGKNAFEGEVRSFLEFDINTIPNNVVIESAELKLFQFDTWGEENFTISLHQVIEVWDEQSITWNKQPAYLIIPESTLSIAAGAISWLSWDITSLLQGWLNGSIANNGVVLKPDSENPNCVISCYSSNYTNNKTLHPKLVINYYIPF